MNSCLAGSDLQNLGDGILAEFERRVAALSRDLCAPFHSEARQLETELLSLYKFVALTTRNEEDLPPVAEAWGMMVHFCDESAKRLHTLVQQNPACGADAYYDRVLDLRNNATACNRCIPKHGVQGADCRARRLI